MSNISDRLKGGAEREPRLPPVTLNEVTLAIQAAMAEGDLMGRLTKLETKMESAEAHWATKAYVLDVTVKQTRWLVGAIISIALSALAVAITVAIRVTS